MPFPAQSALTLLLLGVATLPATLAQEKRGSSNTPHQVTREDDEHQTKAIQSRPLDLGEGLAILGAALDSHHHHVDFSADCSHFVHDLYERAGFPYEYASSSDLYAGVDEFRRVTNPQPGDLAVWRGHAGIVVNPTQHSFFSALRSGPGVDSYNSPYWKRRGRPRFFRYVKPAPGGVLSNATRTASLQPAILGNARPREPEAEDPISDDSEQSPSLTDPSAKLAQNQPANTETPGIVSVHSARPKPDQVSASFLQACQERETRLSWRDFFNPTLMVFGDFEVKKVHIKGNQGWVEIQIDQLLSFTGSNAAVHKDSERQRWPLRRRDNKTWELTPARNTIYLPQQMAERILAHELARLTEDGSNVASKTQHKAELARLLSVLLEK